jgi:hypothetical protein
MPGKWWTGAYCKHFQNALLPLNPVLRAALLGGGAVEMRPCGIFGTPFAARLASGPIAQRLAGEKARNKRQRDYMRKKRGQC